jgi:hypothetical protein
MNQQQSSSSAQAALFFSMKDSGQLPSLTYVTTPTLPTAVAVMKKSTAAAASTPKK